jgi:hypothetical protein
MHADATERRSLSDEKHGREARQFGARGVGALGLAADHIRAVLEERGDMTQKESEDGDAELPRDEPGQAAALPASTVDPSG